MPSAKALPDALALIELPETIRALEAKVSHQQTALYNPRTKSKVSAEELERMHQQLRADQRELESQRRRLRELTS
jgi:hypothetical protein